MTTLVPAEHIAQGLPREPTEDQIMHFAAIVLDMKERQNETDSGNHSGRVGEKRTKKVPTALSSSDSRTTDDPQSTQHLTSDES